MNWKKEGYKVGDTAVLVTEYHYGKSKIEDVEIIYVGTEKLKIARQDKKTMEFRGRSSNGVFFDMSHKIYKNTEEYEQAIKLEEEKTMLKQEIKEYINMLPLEKLRLIKKIIEE